jgi:hypothetical protein
MVAKPYHFLKVNSFTSKRAQKLGILAATASARDI